MKSPRVRLERGDRGVVTLTLDRADQRNALDAEMADAFSAALAEIRADAAARAVLVAGSGPVFCAGGDLGMLRELAEAPPPEARRRMLAFYRSFLGLLDLEAPSVAAIHGAAIGAGLALTFACDVRVVASDAKVGLNFLKLGLSPGMGSTFFLPRLVGPARAAELLLTGRILGGEEAARIGLCHEAVAADAVATRAREVAVELADAAPLAVRATRQALRRDLGGLEAALEQEASFQAHLYGTSDLREGVSAARERRKPRFEGR